MGHAAQRLRAPQHRPLHSHNGLDNQETPTFWTLRITILLTLALMLAPAVALPAAPTSVRLVVDLDELDEAQFTAALRDSQSTLVRRDDRLHFAVVESRQAAVLLGLLGPAVQPDVLAAAGGQPNDPLYPQQWGPRMLRMPEAWELAGAPPESPSPLPIIVAVVDSGVEVDHPDLVDVPQIWGHDYVDGDEEPFDEAGHGTHVAGILAARRGNAVGIAGMADVSLLITRVFDASGVGWCSDVASAVAESAEAGARVINFSGWCGEDLVVLRGAVGAAVNAGALVVSIAGNFQESLEPRAGPADQGLVRCQSVFPGAYRDVIAVGAYDHAFGRGVPAPYSCASRHVELAAPGSGILSTWIGGGYATMSGTSMAAAHVSATAALLMGAHAAAGAWDVRRLMIVTAADMGAPGWDPVFGHGSVDPVAGMEALALR